MAFDFEKLLVYKKAVEFALKIYKETKTFPKEEIFGLISQLRRASVSIPSNIAEGSGRYHKKDFSQFLRIARGSIYECIPLLEIARNERYVTEAGYKNLIDNCNEISKMINGLITSMKDDRN